MTQLNGAGEASNWGNPNLHASGYGYRWNYMQQCMWYYRFIRFNDSSHCNQTNCTLPELNSHCICSGF